MPKTQAVQPTRAKSSARTASQRSASTQKELEALFKRTEEVTTRFEVDSRHQIVRFSDGMLALLAARWTYLRYDQIVSYEILENNHAEAGSGVGRAVVGGLVAGWAGAIVGAATRTSHDVCDSLQVRITARGAERSTYFYEVIKGRSYRNSPYYRNAAQDAQRVASALDIAMQEVAASAPRKRQQPARPARPAQATSADELRKFKALLDDGIITEAEFQAQKAKILGM